MKTKENGVTLIVLVITIVLLLILATVGTTVGTSTLNSAAFTQFKSELKVMQNKVNELNQNNEKEKGTDLNEEQKAVLNIESVSNIIYKDISDSDKSKIQEGFKYCDKKYIQDNFGLDSVKRGYLINVEYRYVIFPEGFEYKKKTYYMIDQIDEELYNVRYNDKNEKTGNFQVNTTMENNKCKITISNIIYNGYVDKWQVKYKLEKDSYWKTSDDLSFYVKEDGIYNIKVVHGDEIDLGTQSVKIILDGLISDKVKNEIVKVGDYVQYTPDIINTSDSGYTNLISELGTYSGSTANTTSTLKQDSLNWRVLDVTDDGEVRLISDGPTTSKITLYGAKGYNNAVKLLDDACKTLYNNTMFVSKAQNLKIEDFQKHLKYDYTQFENLYVDTGKYGGFSNTPYTENTYYPVIYKQEKNNGIGGKKQVGTLDLSEQTQLVDDDTEKTSNLSVTQTQWYKEKILEDDYFEMIYNNIFKKDKDKNDYPTYWLSSRCVRANENTADFAVYTSNDSGSFGARVLYFSKNTNINFSFAFRPVITLKSDIKLDITDTTKDGSTAANAWIIK